MNFSERELGFPARNVEKLSDRAWHGLVAIVNKLIADESFGDSFPYYCGKCGEHAGYDKRMFDSSLFSEVGIKEWDIFKSNILDEYYRDQYCIESQISQEKLTLIFMDIVEFCHKNCAQAKSKKSSYGCWSHGGIAYEKYDREISQLKFKDDINGIFQKNGLAYELQDNGEVKRLIPFFLKEKIPEFFKTGDDELDGLLEVAKVKFLSPSFSVRKESLEKLWDAWERLKTIEHPSDKKKSITLLLEKKTNNEENFFEILDEEAKKLTGIGNNFMIRHTEVGKTPIKDSDHVDYLFQRMMSMILLLVK